MSDSEERSRRLDLERRYGELRGEGMSFAQAIKALMSEHGVSLEAARYAGLCVDHGGVEGARTARQRSADREAAPFAFEIDGQPLETSDSTIESYGQQGMVLRVRLTLWNASPAELVFEQVGGVMANLPGDLDAIVVDDDPNHPFALDVVADLSGTRLIPVREFRFLDPYDRVSMRVVCEADGRAYARRPPEDD